MKVLLSNRGNPDHRQDPERPLPGTPKDHWLESPDIPTCVLLCREYIHEHDLGGGNWTGGIVVQPAVNPETVGRDSVGP